MNKQYENQNNYTYSPYSNLDQYEATTAHRATLGGVPYNNDDGTWLNWMGLLMGIVDDEQKSIDYYIQTLGLTEGRLARKEERKYAEKLYRDYRKEVINWDTTKGIETLESFVDELIVYSNLGYKFEELEDGCLIIERNGGKAYEF